MNAVKEKESARPFAPSDAADSFSPSHLVDLLACPSCLLEHGPSDTAALTEDLRCERCGSWFPSVDMPRGGQVPWLFADPSSAHREWQHRYVQLMSQLDAQVKQHDGVLDTNLPAYTQRRVERQRDALREYAKQIEAILAPFKLDGRHEPSAPAHRLPNAQTITSYATNVFRDWAWGREELRATADVIGELLVKTAISDLGETLTLGAGPGGLTYLLERDHEMRRSVNFDINPFFAAIQQCVKAGGSIDLFEFPIAPIDLTSAAVLRRLASEHLDGRRSRALGTHYVLGDIAELPFKAASFDTIVTPWLIDILPSPADRWLALINRSLKAGGVWIFTGSLNFEAGMPAVSYSTEEFIERVRDLGFVVEALDFRPLAYLQSPASGHSRFERVMTFVAVKERESAWQMPTAASRELPVPENDALQFACSTHMLKAQILGAVNGKRTVDDIAAAISRRYRLDPRAARQRVEAVLDPYR